MATAVRPPVKSIRSCEESPAPRRIRRVAPGPMQLTINSIGWMAYSSKERPPPQATMCRSAFLPPSASVAAWTFV